MNRFIAFDVETPNSENRRMSAIGITAIENGEIKESFYSLVNPGTYFDAFNIALTGITPEAAAKAPEFPELFDRIEPLLSGGILLAHNAPFDMSVLGKCLRDYGIPYRRYAKYACTLAMGRKAYPQLQNHRLSTLCEFLKINLSHHNAGSDAEACARLFIDYKQKGLSEESFIREYDMYECRTQKLKRKV